MLIGISKAGWDTLTQGQKDVIRDALQAVALGHPLRMEAPDTSIYFSFMDGRIRMIDYAAVGCFAANRADWPTNYTIPLDGEGNVDKSALISDLMSFLTNPARTYPFVHPDNVTPADSDVGLTPEDVLTANQAPAAIFASMDPTWVPWEPETP